MDYVPNLEGILTSRDKLKLIKQAGRRMYRAARKSDRDDFELSENDVAVLRRLASEDVPELRAAAVDILGDFGPVTWQDAETWTLDENEAVRQSAFFRISLSFYALARLCESDKRRCVELFAKSAKRYGVFPVEGWSLCSEDDGGEWVEAFWSCLGPLLDVGDAALNSNIICGVLEDILVHEAIGVDDPRVQSWINGDSIERKMALLSVVQWFGMREPWQKKIAEALADDPASVVSSTTRSFLAGKPEPDIQTREWSQ